MLHYKLRCKWLVLMGVMVFTISACVNVKTMVYFNKSNNTDTIKSFLRKEVTFKPGDIVIVSIFSPSKESTAYFNYGDEHASVAGVPANGYLIDNYGNIELPMIGKISMMGHTCKEVQEEVRTRVERYVINPAINVRLVNFTVTLLGEFKKPGTFIIEDNTITLLEALGKSEDLMPTAQRSITLIREINGEKSFTKIDLTHKEQFASDIFLQNGDVIYAAPIKEKTIPLDIFYRVAPFVVSAATFLTFLIFNVNKK
jgi:polysaccharide biosynthesis/export protein